MFKYSKENEITALYQELDKYKGIGDEETVQEFLENLPFGLTKKEAVAKIKDRLDHLLEDKKFQHKAYNQRLRDEATQSAREKHKHLVKEYHDCIRRAIEIGENNIINSDFNLGDYIEYKHVRSGLKSNLHMVSVKLETLNRQTKD